MSRDTHKTKPRKEKQNSPTIVEGNGEQGFFDTLPKRLPEKDRSARALKIRHIVIHTTAGFAPANSVQAYFLRKKEKGGRGWSRGGYHVIINRDGSKHYFYDFGVLTNGVKGFNAETIHISYVGGIEKNAKTGRYYSKDTRNDLQKQAIKELIEEVIIWLHVNGKDVTKDLQVVGHRDFSNDKNKDNVIQPWERIKDCPCFDAIPEYIEYSSKDRKGTLPTKK